MAARHRETLLLSLPPDPGLAGLAHLVALHFFRQNGLKAASARSGADRVERGWRAVTRRAGRPSAAGRHSLMFIAADGFLEVLARRSGGWQRRLAKFERSAES